MSSSAKSRVRLSQLSSSYWDAAAAGGGREIDVTPSAELRPDPAGEVDANELEAVTVSDHSTCAGCGLVFDSFTTQRAHFKSDLHKFNARRRAKGRHALTADEFDSLDRQDAVSLGSISASEDEVSSDSEEEGLPQAGAAVPSSGKLEFEDPTSPLRYIVVYKVALPDQSSLASLAQRGSWAVLMSGGGHFAACIWDANGLSTHHKTFHRYTSRRKQGGSQSVADAAGGRRIRSAGATLRRHGEQQLQKEVRALLLSWAQQLERVQCVFVRASIRERRDLISGWDGSPLGTLAKQDQVRTIPFPTRRATLKEVTRVYEELMTAILSATSLTSVEAIHHESSAKSELKETKFTAAPDKASRLPALPKERGTAHLKKRLEKSEADKIDATTPLALDQDSTSHDGDEGTAPPSLPIDEEKVQLVRACVTGDLEYLRTALANGEGIESTAEKTCTFQSAYFKDFDALADTTETLGLVGVAAVAGCVPALTWLLDNGFSPCSGASPYLTTKSKAARNALRRYWSVNPDAYDYAAAGVPGPLTDEDMAREAERKRRERMKKREKKDQKAEAEKPPEVRARELRAAAAESRFLGNRCARCNRSLEGMTPFERLSYKYCSTDCVSKHRAMLAGQK